MENLPIILTVIGTGAALGGTLAGLILNGQRRTSKAIERLEYNVGNLRERMARVEGLLEGYVAQGHLPQAQ